MGKCFGKKQDQYTSLANEDDKHDANHNDIILIRHYKDEPINNFIDGTEMQIYYYVL